MTASTYSDASTPSSGFNRSADRAIESTAAAARSSVTRREARAGMRPAGCWMAGWCRGGGRAAHWWVGHGAAVRERGGLAVRRDTPHRTESGQVRRQPTISRASWTWELVSHTRRLRLACVYHQPDPLNRSRLRMTRGGSAVRTASPWPARNVRRRAVWRRLSCGRSSSGGSERLRR